MSTVSPEISNMITDYILGIWSVYLAVRLYKENKLIRHKSISLWETVFIATAICAFSGGSYHGLKSLISSTYLEILWRIMLYSLALASLFLMSAVITAVFSDTLRKWLIRVAIIKFLVLAVYLGWNTDFIDVMYDYVPSLIIILIMLIVIKVKNRDSYAHWIIAGIVITFVGSGVYISKLSIHKTYFNDSDIMHVLQMVSMYLWYKGGILMGNQAVIQDKNHGY
ncbi:DUF6962 family protein [candidate division KSB1 bacterium]